MSAERANLQSAIAAGDVQAEDDLCHTFAPRILRLVERSFANRTEAQDIASEILEAVLANLRRGAFRGECQLGTYVYAIARNKIAERIRRRGPEPATLDEGLPDSRPSPEDLAAQKESGARSGTLWPSSTGNTATCSICIITRDWRFPRSRAPSGFRPKR